MKQLMGAQGYGDSQPGFRRHKILAQQLLELFQAVIEGLADNEQLLGGKLLGAVMVQVHPERGQKIGAFGPVIIQNSSQVAADKLLQRAGIV
ncbi:hypothetical protein D3C81_2143560 [compost metagenome]